MQSSLENSTGSRKIVSKTEYTANKNYVSKQTDARGKSVTTITDANKGWVTAVTDPKNQTVNYTHDTLGRVTAVTATADGVTYRNAYTYDGDKLMQVAHNTGSDSTCDVTYNFAYDSQNRRTTVKVGTQLLSENVYNTTKGDIKYGTLTKSIFGNGGEVRYSYDDFKRVTGIQYDADSEDRYKFEYGANGQLARVTDNLLNRTTLSEYDISNRPMRKTTVEGTTNVYLGEVTYDEYSNLASFREQVGSARTAYRTDFTYDTENKPTKLTYGSTSNQVVYAYDDIGRMTTRTATVGGKAYAATYGYTAGGHGTGTTTGLIASISQTGGNFSYTYDDNGNITSVVQDGVTTTYTYDGLGQLIRVDDGHENATWVYEYDRGGNITSKSKYALGVTSGTPVESKTFTYGNSNWKDQLTAVNGVGIAYDEIGNPTSDGTWTYTWEKGRQLKSMSNGSTTASFKYNSDGLRVQKTVGGVVTNYTLHGKNIVHMTQGSNALHFFYDASNKPAIVEYNGTKYAYVHNLQGDIVAILDSNSNVVVQYKYDAWGRIISKTGSLASTLGTVQPFRYRGYVFDEETGLYYLRSRYYSHVFTRFLNADILYTAYRSQYQYCKNNPVKNSDLNGFSHSDATTKPWYARLQNRDGSYSLYDNDRFRDDNKFHEQILVVNVAPLDFDMNDGDLTFVSAEFDFITGGWETDNVDVSLLDLGHAEASFEINVDEGKLSVGAMASVWSPSISFSLFGWDITLGLEILSVGMQTEVDLNTTSASYAHGYGLWGWSIEVDW